MLKRVAFASSLYSCFMLLCIQANGYNKFKKTFAYNPMNKKKRQIKIFNQNLF